MRLAPKSPLATSIYTLCTCLALPAVARAVAFELGGGLGADFNAGGDTLVEIEFDDGDEQDIKGGNGVSLFAAGGPLFFEDYQHRLQLVASLGIKYSTMQPTSNADLTFVRFPLELLGFYRNDDWHFRVGGGAALHVGNSLTGSGAISGLDLELENALGGIVQADFVSGGWFFGMRYTAIGYPVRGVDGAAAANSLGLTLGYMVRLGAE